MSLSKAILLLSTLDHIAASAVNSKVTAQNASTTSNLSSTIGTFTTPSRYILQSLNSASNTGSISSSLTSSVNASSTSSSTAGSPSDGASWQACQTSLVAYEEALLKSWYTAHVTVDHIPASTTYGCLANTFTVGEAAAPYTTINGYPHVKGTYSTYSTIITTCAETIDPERVYTSLATNITSPTCTIPPPQCSSMWRSYLESLGVPASNLESATEPLITPTPSNRPRCSLGTIHFSCSTAPPVFNSCSILFNSVKLLYWPVTASPTATQKDAPPVTALFGTHTLVSPSVYISVGPLAASFLQPTTCSFVTPLGAPTAWYDNPNPVGLGQPPQPTNSIVIPGNILTLAPDRLSSLIFDIGAGVDTSSFVRSVASFGGRAASPQYLTRPVNYTQLALPPTPEDYYLIPAAYQHLINYPWPCNGSTQIWPFDNCPDIFDDLYSPQLAVPEEWHSMLPEAWKVCTWSEMAGLYDPPSALTPATAVPGAALPSFMASVPAPVSVLTSPTASSSADGDAGVSATAASPGSAVVPFSALTRPTPVPDGGESEGGSGGQFPDLQLPGGDDGGASSATLGFATNGGVRPVGALPSAVVTLPGGGAAVTMVAVEGGSSAFCVAGTTLSVGGSALVVGDGGVTISAANGGMVVVEQQGGGSAGMGTETMLQGAWSGNGGAGIWSTGVVTTTIAFQAGDLETTAVPLPPAAAAETGSIGESGATTGVGTASMRHSNGAATRLGSRDGWGGLSTASFTTALSLVLFCVVL